MSECDHNCETCGASCASRASGASAEDLRAPANEMSRIGKVIAVVSGKGGVGKSLVTGLLASACRRAGKQVAVLDADITGPSAPRMFGITEHAEGCEFGILPQRSETGIKVMSVNLLLEDESAPVVWRGALISGTVRQFWTDVVWDDTDVMFVDMPPGTGDVPLTVFQSLPVDGIVVVTSPQDLVGMIVGKAIRMADMMRIPVLALVENFSYLTCPDCGREIAVFGESKVADVAAAHKIPVTARLPLDPTLAGLADAGRIERYETNALDDVLAAIERIGNDRGAKQ